MKEILQVRVRQEYVHLPWAQDEGKKMGTSIRAVEVARDDPRYDRIPPEN
jgi:hypothetical protein